MSYYRTRPLCNCSDPYKEEPCDIYDMHSCTTCGHYDCIGECGNEERRLEYEADEAISQMLLKKERDARDAAAVRLGLLSG